MADAAPASLATGNKVEGSGEIAALILFYAGGAATLFGRVGTCARPCKILGRAPFSTIDSWEANRCASTESNRASPGIRDSVVESSE